MKQLKIVVFLLLLFNINLYSQRACDVPTGFDLYPFMVPHVSNVIGDSGFALSYSYPGMWSYFGQMNLYYTNSNEDSFFFGVGLPYLMIGMNKVVASGISKLFINLNLGISENFIGSIGITNIYKLNNNDYFGINLDLFYFGELNGDMMIPNIPPSWGQLINIDYTYSTKYFNFTFFAGVTFTKFYSYEVEYYEDDFWMQGYVCTTRDEPIWTDFYTNFPIGFSLTAKF